MEALTQSTGGKIAIGVVLVAAVVAIGFQVAHLGDSEKSRDVPKTEAISEAQQQIDAINKMTNLSPLAKKSMLDHLQGQINTANGAGGAPQPAAAGRGGPPPPPPPQ